MVRAELPWSLKARIPALPVPTGSQRKPLSPEIGPRFRRRSAGSRLGRLGWADWVGGRRSGGDCAAPGPAAPLPEVDPLPLPAPPLCSWVSHVGRSRRPGSHSTTVTLIGAQGNSEGAASQMFLLPSASPGCDFLTQGNAEGRTHARLSDSGFVSVWTEVFSETYNRQCLPM